MATIPLKRPSFQEPVTDLTFPGLGKTANFKLPLGKKLLNFIITLTVVASATGAATKTIPRPQWGITEQRFQLGNVNRTRQPQELYGMYGLLARNSKQSGGTVQYSQGGNVVTVAFNGRTIGLVPVLIDSAADYALQAALANNTATTAVFYLPNPFAEYYRKDPQWGGENLGLITGFDDGTGKVGATLGTPYFYLDIPAATGVAGTMTNVNLAGSLVYSEDLAPAGSVINMCKHKVHPLNYAAGDNECALNFETKDLLQRFSILCVGDTITKIVVKKGSRIVKQMTFGESQCADMVAEIVGDSAIVNRFDVDLDQDDDPTKSLAMDQVNKFSIVATFATAADVPASARCLADYWGPVEN
jgi:hypothetical protein